MVPKKVSVDMAEISKLSCVHDFKALFSASF